MVSKTVRLGLGLMALAALVACGRKGEMIPNEVKSGPDEFSIVPAKPLQEPESYTSLPVPTPGGTNRTDATPNADAIIALGGRVDRKSVV